MKLKIRCGVRIMIRSKWKDKSAFANALHSELFGSSGQISTLGAEIHEFSLLFSIFKFEARVWENPPGGFSHSGKYHKQTSHDYYLFYFFRTDSWSLKKQGILICMFAIVESQSRSNSKSFEIFQEVKFNCTPVLIKVITVPRKFSKYFQYRTIQ